MTHELAYLAFGATLCAALAVLAAHYFRRGAKERVEGPKYRMLEDDDDRR